MPADTLMAYVHAALSLRSGAKRATDVCLSGRCALAASPLGDQREAGLALRTWGFVAVAQGVEELTQGDAEGVSEGVPGAQRASGAALFDLDEGAAGQAAMGGELVIAPAALRA